MVASGTASTMPTPNSAGGVTRACAFAPGGTRSRSTPRARSKGVVRIWMLLPPCSVRGSQRSGGSKRVARRTASAPVPPLVGRSWHELHRSWLNRGPSPSAGVKAWLNRARPCSKRASSAWLRPGSGAPGSAPIGLPAPGRQPHNGTATTSAVPTRLAH